MTFWMLAAVMAALLVLALLRPLLRQRGFAPATADFDRAVYRDQLAELEQDLQRGLLDPTAAEAARREIQRRLLQAETNAGGTAPGAAGPGLRRFALALVVVVPPALGLGLYLQLGTPGLPGLPLAERDPGGPAEVALLAERLEARVTADPTDIEARLVLAQVYERSGNYAAAADHYRGAIALIAGYGEVPGALHAALGETLVAAAGGRVGRDARVAFAAAIEADPGNSRARYYAGLAMAQDGRLQEALGVWQSLAEDSPPGSPWRGLLQEQMARAAGELGIEPPAAALPEEPDATTGPSRADIEAARTMTPEERQGFIRSMVERLAGRLQEEPADPDGWLRLARAYTVLGETAKAGQALAEAETRISALPGETPERDELVRRLEALRAELP